MMEQDTSHLDDLGSKLEAEKEEAVSWRTPYEQRWLDAEKQIREGYTKLSETKDIRTKQPHQIADNITKQKVRTISARIGDMLFPTNDSNFSIENSPIPALSPIAQTPGAEQDAAAKQQLAEQSAEQMEQTVKDYLDECNFAAQGRLAIDDGCGPGTGVIKGPFPKKVKHKATNTVQTPAGPVSSIVYEEKIAPHGSHVELRNFFPYPARNMRECPKVFELHLYTKQQAAKLADEPGFNKEQVNALLQSEPELGALVSRPCVDAAVMKDRYSIWEYHGPIPKGCLSYFGVEVSDDDKLTVVNGEVWFCQGVVLKAVLSDVERPPYYTWSYEKDPNSIFGYGVPHTIEHDQHAANIAWSAMLLNATQSAFPITSIAKGAYTVEAGDEKWPPRRPVIVNAPDMDLGKVIQFTVVPSTLDTTSVIYERAKQNADEHSMLPVMAQGEPSNAVPTASGMAMLLNASNVVQRYAAKQWDDEITVPFVGAVVDWELLHGQNPANKGVFDVIPKAASHLLVKDVQLQQSMQLLMLADNPNNAIYFKREDLIRNVVSHLDMPSDQILNSPEEVKALQQQQAQQPNPEAIKAEVEKYKADKQFEAAMAKAQSDKEIAQMKANADVLVARMGMQAATIQAASDERMTAEEQATRANIAALDTEAKNYQATLTDQRERQKDATKTTLEATKIVNEQASLNAELQHEDPFRH